MFVRSAFEAQAVPALHEPKLFPPGSSARKDASGGALYSSAETCKQRLRGAVVVQYTYGWDILAKTGGSGQLGSPPQSPSCYASVGLEATVSGGG